MCVTQILPLLVVRSPVARGVGATLELRSTLRVCICICICIGVFVGVGVSICICICICYDYYILYILY